MRRRLSLAALVLVACGGAVASEDENVPEPAPPAAATPPSSPATSASNRPEEPTPTGAPVATIDPATAGGCSDVIVYARYGANRWVVVHADAKALGLAAPGDTATVDLGAPKVLATLFVDTFATPPASAPYCDDVATAPPSSHRLAAKGSVRLRVTAVSNEGGDRRYRVDVALENVRVPTDADALEVVPDVALQDVAVGWYPG